MGADFIFAAAEMPPVPTLQGRGLHHDDPAKDAIVSRLRVAIIRDQELLTDLLEQDYYSILEENASNFGVDVDWDNRSLILACTMDVADAMEADLRAWWNGSWGREWNTLDTYNSKGEEITLTVSGEMSWGDVPEFCSVLWRFARLPDGWFK